MCYTFVITTRRTLTCFINPVNQHYTIMRTPKILLTTLLSVIALAIHAQWTPPNPNTYFTGGNVGIGTSSPGFPLTVLTTNTNPYANIASFRNDAGSNSWILVANNKGQVNLGMGGTVPYGYIWSSTNKFFIGDEGNGTLFVDGMANGNVSIGTPDSKGYKLAVAGDAIFTKVVVKPYPFPDYVFHTNYRLRPLSEVEQYIKQYGHLPEVPTAEEVEKNGLDVGDNQITLLKKIEELTLYVIEQNKKIEALDKKIEDQHTVIAAMQKK
jgi:hypothetical protein